MDAIVSYLSRATEAELSRAGFANFHHATGAAAFTSALAPPA